MASCNLMIHRTETGYLIRMDGRGTMKESPTVRDFVCGAIEDGADIVLDLSRCDYLDSTCLGCLVMLHKRGQSGRGSFGVFAEPDVQKRLFGSSQLQKFIRMIDRFPPCDDEGVTLELTNLDRTEFCVHLLETHRRLAELGGPSSETFQRIADSMEADMQRQGMDGTSK